jgi:hypothetical protein
VVGDRGAALEIWALLRDHGSALHTPEMIPCLVNRSFYALVVDRAGPVADLRDLGTRASEVAGHR